MDVAAMCEANKLFFGAFNENGSLKELLELPPHLYKCGGSDVYAEAHLFGKPPVGAIVKNSEE